MNGFPLSLPDNVEWDADSGVLSVEGNTYATGDVVAWGGGYSAPTPDDLPASCPPGELAKVYTFD